MTPLDAAFVAAIDAGGPARSGSPVTVGAPGDPIVEALRGSGGRVVVAAGEGSRLVVGAGVALAGPRALVLAGRGTIVPRALGGAQVAVVRDGTAAELLRRAGWTVAQPVWPDDVSPLLQAVLAADHPVALRLHAHHWPDVQLAPGPAVLGVPRVLSEGRAGMLVASGRLAADLLAMARALEQHGLEITAVDAHTRGPRAARPSVVDTDTSLLVGGPKSAEDFHAGRLRLGTLHHVAVPPGDPGAIEVVLDALPEPVS